MMTGYNRPQTADRRPQTADRRPQTCLSSTSPPEPLVGGQSRDRSRSTGAARAAAGPLLALAALLAAPMLGAGGLAHAQTQTEIWSATLTPGAFGTVVGCHAVFAGINAAMDCASSSVLSDDEFTHDTTAYTIQILQVNTNDAGEAGLLINVDPDFTASAAELTLTVDGTPFAFTAGVSAVGGTPSWAWNDTGLSWTVGQSVSLSLTRTPLRPPTPTITYEGREPAGGFRVKVTWSEAVEGFMEIDEGTGYQHDLHAGYNGGPGVFIKTFEEMTAGLVYTAVVPVAPPSGTPKMSVSVLPGAATALVGGQENMAGHLLLEVDGSGYPVTVLLPVVQQVEIVPPGGRGSSSRSAFPTHSADSGQSTFGSRSVEASPEVEVSWTAGENVEVRMTFSEPVTVDLTDGTATLGLVVAGQERSARYSDGSGTHALTFGYEVIEADGTVTAVSVTANSLALNGATIRNSSGVDAGLTHPGASLGGTDEPAAAVPLTASFTNAPPEHDGSGTFTFRILFSQPIGISYQTLRDESLTVTGGTVTRARRVDGRHDLWEITVEPSGAEDVTITLAGGRDCGTTGAVCTREDTPRALTNSPSATVQGPSASEGDPPSDPPDDPSDPLTASFSGVPGEHTGESFTFGLTFSEDVAGLNYKTLRDSAFSVTNGQVTRARRQTQGTNQGWTITVEPDSPAAVTVTLPAGSVETADGRGLERAVSATVAGPVGIAVADAQVEEAVGAVLAFVVTLERAASGTVTVDYATADGTATAGADYTATSGTLRFAAGETSKTVSVTVLDDAHDDGGETVTLTLSNPSGGRLTDGQATGTIENRDPLPRALLARFGRTAAVHVVEHVEERIAAPRAPGVEGRFAGRALRPGMEREMALSFLNRLGGSAGAHPLGGGARGPLGGSPAGGMGSLGTPRLAAGTPMAAAGGPMGAVSGLGATAGPLGAAGPHGGLNDGGLLQMGLGGGDLLTGSAFAMNRETHGGILSFWSRGAQSNFSGREGALSLGGDVRTTMFGADYAKGPLVAGLSLSHSRGLGEYAGVAGGQVASSVTGLYPWLGYKATERVTVWGVAGYGAGGLLLTPQGGPALEAGLSMAMAAAGTRGELVAGGAGGFALAFKADALWVGTATDGVDGPAGRLAATEAAVTRFRTGLEGSRAYTLAGRLSLTPSVEVGLRHDGGDAETGAGMDVGAGLIVSDASTGLAVDVRVRTLLVHQAEGFRERGVAVSLSYNPTPSTPLGFVARVAPSWGGQAQSGAEALWGRETMAGMAHGGLAQGNRFDGEVGYGLPVGSRLVGTPRVGFTTSEYGRDYRVGYGLGVLDRESLNVELGVDAQRRESPMLGGTSNGVLGRASLGW